MSRRGVFTVLILAAVAIASLAVGVAAYIRRLPAPEEADREGIFRWLVERDLRAEPHDLQIRLVRRVEKELLAGVDFRDALGKLDAAQRQRLVANADQLAHCWFVGAADRYFATPQDGRPAILDQQIEQLQRLGIIDQLAALEAGPGARGQGPGTRGQGPEIDRQTAARESRGQNPDPAGTLASQDKRVERWLAGAEGDERQRLTEYFAALRDRMLLASLQQWLPKF